MILNLGCGSDFYGDVRIDVLLTKAVNIISDIEGTLPLRSNIFHLVYSKSVFEHLRNPSLSLLEMKRVMRRNAKLIIITDNASYWRFHLPISIKRMRWMERHGEYSCGPGDAHYGLYQFEHLKAHIKKVGLELCSISYIPYDGGLGFIDKILFLHPLIRHIVFPRIKVIARLKSDH